MKTNGTKKQTKQMRETKAPDFIAWHVDNRNEEKAFWTRIGSAWLHQDGNGLTVQLDLSPTSGGRIVLRAPKATEPAKM